MINVSFLLVSLTRLLEIILDSHFSLFASGFKFTLIHILNYIQKGTECFKMKIRARKTSDIVLIHFRTSPAALNPRLVDWKSKEEKKKIRYKYKFYM